MLPSRIAPMRAIFFIPHLKESLYHIPALIITANTEDIFE